MHEASSELIPLSGTEHHPDDYLRFAKRPLGHVGTCMGEPVSPATVCDLSVFGPITGVILKWRHTAIHCLSAARNRSSDQRPNADKSQDKDSFSFVNPKFKDSTKNFGADNGIRTRDRLVGNEKLYL